MAMAARASAEFDTEGNSYTASAGSLVLCLYFMNVILL